MTGHAHANEIVSHLDTRLQRAALTLLKECSEAAPMQGQDRGHRNADRGVDPAQRWPDALGREVIQQVPADGECRGQRAQ